ncbi:MAG: hypothetical protein HEEMFOPI_01536 [Holosporales bacterium]
MIFYKFLFVFFCCVFVSNIGFSTQFLPAIEMSRESIKAVRVCVVDGTCFGSINNRKLLINGTMVFELTDTKQLVIVPSFNSPIFLVRNFSYFDQKAEKEYDILITYMNEFYKDQLKNFNIVFAGVSTNGNLAMCLAKIFKCKTEDLLPNQVHVVTFYSSFCGSTIESDEIRKVLHQKNILQFIPKTFFAKTNTLGVKFEILPWEEIGLNLKTIYNSLKYEFLFLSLFGFKTMNRFVFQSFMVDIMKKNNIINNIVSCLYYNCKADIPLKDIIFRCVCLLSYRIMNKLEKSRISEHALMLSFDSFKNNWEFRSHAYDNGIFSNEEQVLLNAGCVSWFSVQRNISMKFAMKLIGGY